MYLRIRNNSSWLECKPGPRPCTFELRGGPRGERARARRHLAAQTRIVSAGELCVTLANINLKSSQTDGSRTHFRVRSPPSPATQSVSEGAGTSEKRARFYIDLATE